MPRIDFRQDRGKVMSIGSALCCKNCGRPIPLRAPNRLEKPRHQSSWPSGSRLENYLCPHCKHVFAYLAPESQENLLDMLAQAEVGRYDTVVCVEVSCGKEECRTLIEVNIPMESGVGSRELEAKHLLSLATFCDIHCARCGYVLEGSPGAGKKLGRFGGFCPQSGFPS
jgi:hypothetical protein